MWRLRVSILNMLANKSVLLLTWYNDILWPKLPDLRIFCLRSQYEGLESDHGRSCSRAPDGNAVYGEIFIPSSGSHCLR